MLTIKTKVLVVGGGVGGVAAALALGRRGVACVVTEETDWIGGQLTAQAVPPDENRWIEGDGWAGGVQGATRSYLEYRSRVRAWYRENRNLTPAARANARLNPGNGWVSHLCHEPVVGHAVLTEMVAPYVAAGLVKIVLNARPIRMEMVGDVARAVVFEHLGPRTSTLGGSKHTGETQIEAEYILDATELGDLLALGGIEHFLGGEHRDAHGELHGRTDASDPADLQAISWCFALEHRPGEDHTIDRPASYGFWRDWVPPLSPAWPGRLLSWTQVGGADHKPREFRWLPWPAEPDVGEWEMWRYRRIVDRAIYERPAALPDVALVNMVQMDYFLKPSLTQGSAINYAERESVFGEAKELSRCFLYWMQTDAPRFDGTSGTGYPGLRLRGDELGTVDGFAKYPYIREARRLDALQVVSERHVGMAQRRAEGLVRPADPEWGVGECFADSVGIGHYRLDLHPSAAMRHSLYVEAAPFRIPLGALIPKRVTNVIAAGKCLGVTHITNGCYRLHPVEWNIGEAAGHLAGHCVARGVAPAAVRESAPRLREFQAEIVSAGLPLAWPWENAANLS